MGGSRPNNYQRRSFLQRANCLNGFDGWEHPGCFHIYTVSLLEAAGILDPGHEQTPSCVSQMHLALEYYHIALTALLRHQIRIGDESVESQSGVCLCLMFHGIKIKRGIEEAE